MRKNRTYHLAELLYKSVKSVVSKTQGGLYMYTMQLPCICTYVWLVVTEICMVSVTSRNVPKFGTEGRCFMNKVVLVVIALIFLASLVILLCLCKESINWRDKNVHMISKKAWNRKKKILWIHSRRG